MRACAGPFQDVPSPLRTVIGLGKALRAKAACNAVEGWGPALDQSPSLALCPLHTSLLSHCQILL